MEEWQPPKYKPKHYTNKGWFDQCGWDVIGIIGWDEFQKSSPKTAQHFDDLMKFRITLKHSDVIYIYQNKMSPPKIAFRMNPFDIKFPETPDLCDELFKNCIKEDVAQ
jgi:hypothetical protein